MFGEHASTDDLYFEYGQTEVDHLSQVCKRLGAVIERVGKIKNKINPNLFYLLVESVVAQQVSRKAAATVSGRLHALTGMEAEKLHSMPVESIQACGMSMRRATYIKNVAHAAVSKNIDFNSLHAKSDEEVIAALTSIKGVGLWTAEMLLIFSLARPNVVSFGDLAIRRGMMRLYGHKEMPKERFMRYAKLYAPYGSVASLYLWYISDPDFVL